LIPVYRWWENFSFSSFQKLDLYPRDQDHCQIHETVQWLWHGEVQWFSKLTDQSLCKYVRIVNFKKYPNSGAFHKKKANLEQLVKNHDWDCYSRMKKSTVCVSKV
jgi:hypothetical protein